jgi:translation initiation factor IF-3
MGNILPDPKKRDYLLPPSCKNLSDVLLPSPTHSSSDIPVRVNAKISADQVQVVDEYGKQFGIMSLGDALSLARSRGVDLVEIEPAANPPVCRIIDFGKFRYEAVKKRRRSADAG